VLSSELLNAYNEAKFEHAAIDILDRISPESIAKQHPTYEAFNDDFKLDNELIKVFYANTGLEAETLSGIDKKFIEAMLMATIAEPIYGGYARHYIYGTCFDPMMRQAITIASDEELMHNTLL
jgi:hypothetical protein